MLLIRFLIISICLLYILRKLAGWLLPALFRSMVNKAQQQQFSQQPPPAKPEGKIRVDYMPPGPKNSIPDNEGDFVDYEEVK